MLYLNISLTIVTHVHDRGFWFNYLKNNIKIRFYFEIESSILIISVWHFFLIVLRCGC